MGTADFICNVAAVTELITFVSAVNNILLSEDALAGETQCCGRI